MRHLCPARRSVHVIEPLESRIAPATFIVNLNSDEPDASPGDGVADTDLATPGLQTTLRAAIMEANAHANSGGADVISFSGIPASGAFIITLNNVLPLISEAVIIDGYTAPGAKMNTASVGTNAVLRVELDGSQLSAGSGLVLGDDNLDPNATGGSTVRGLAIANFPHLINETGYGIFIQSNGNHVEGNFIGTDLTGLTEQGNESAGVGINGVATYTSNIIGGSTLGVRNLISGNALGIEVPPSASSTFIQGNLIGTDATGLTALGNHGAGILNSGSVTTIGGATTPTKNVVSGNEGVGILITNALGTSVRGNYIGVGADGTTPLGNDDAGIRVEGGSTAVTIGNGATSANVIASNGGAGIQVGSNSGAGVADLVIIQDNFIGTDATRTRALGNSGPGIAIYGSSGSNIGNGGPNFIANNKGAGIYLTDEAGPTHVLITQNSFLHNGGLAIDLHGGVENNFSVNTIDTLDADAGPNGLTNAPTLGTVNNTGTAQTIPVSITGRPNATYTIDFYANAPDQVDPSGTGEGLVYLGSKSVSTDGSGTGTATFTGSAALPTNTYFTATATDTANTETSEFSLASGPAPATYTWTGAQSTDWFNPANWSPNGIPGPFDVAILNAAGNNGIVLTQDVGVASFQQSGGTLGGTGTLSIRTNWSWTGGTHLKGGVVLADKATANLNGSAALTWSDGTLDLFGTATVNGAGLNFDQGSAILETSGVLTLNAGVTDVVAGTASNFDNHGKIDKLSTGTFGLNFSSVSNSGGTINSKGGTLLLGAFTQFGGTINLTGGDISAPAGFSLLDGELDGGGTIVGNVINDGGAIDPGGSGVVSTITIQGTYNQTGAGTLRADIGGTTAGVNHDQLVVTGAATISGGLQVTLKPSFVPQLGDIYVVLSVGSRTGSFSFVLGEGTLFQNSTPTTIQLERSGATRTWDAGGGADTDWFNPLNWSQDTVPGSADVAVLNTAATITLTADATVGDFIQSAGTLTGTKTLTALSSIQWSGGSETGTGQTVGSFEANVIISGGANKILNTRLLQIQGQGVDTGSGAIVLLNGAKFQDSGLFDLQSTGSFSAGAGSGTIQIDSEAILRKSGAGTITLAPEFTFNNGGILDVKTGTFVLQSSGGAQDGAVFSSDLGAQITLATSLYTLTGAVTFTGQGVVTLTGGTLQQNGSTLTIDAGSSFSFGGGTINSTGASAIIANGSFLWFAGTLSGNGTLAANGVSSVTGTGARSLSGWIFKIGPTGTSTWTSTTDIQLLQNADIQVNGLMDITGPLNIIKGDAAGGTVTVQTTGTLQDSGQSTATIQVPVTNFGLLSATSTGTLQLTDFTQSGGATFVASGATIGVTNGMTLSAGKLAGSGTIAGTVTNVGGVVAPGALVGGRGVLTITGDYVQGSSGALEIEAQNTTPGTGFDQVSVGGNALLAGTLAFVPINAFALTTSTDLTVLTATSVSGTFDSFSGPLTAAPSITATAVHVLGAPDPLVVTTESDTVNSGDGVTSLREAIIFANNNPGTDTISFNIPGAGFHFIAINGTALPDITDTLIIDGYSQPGSAKNTLGTGGNAVLLIGLDGTSAGAAANGLTVKAATSQVSGLVIKSFGGAAISVQAGAATITGNYLGTDETGALAASNGTGLEITGTVTGGTIGDTAAADRNVISGNTIGVALLGSSVSNVQISGNYIGTSASGTAALGNSQYGVLIQGAGDNFVGSTLLGGSNVISGNGSAGVRIEQAGATNNVVQANLIGLNAAGTAVLGNGGDGVAVASGAGGNLIGGSGTVAGNIIGGNTGNGISIAGPGSNVVQGNIIGTDPTGLLDYHNQAHGILITDSSDNLIGGTGGLDGNRIRLNSQSGLVVAGTTSRGNQILGNAIYNNTAWNLDLAGDGRTNNDGAPDGDSGPNDLLNFPVLTAVSTGAGSATVNGTIDSLPSTTLRIEFFAGPPTSGAGPQARVFLGFKDVSTDASGHAVFSADVIGLLPGDFITATATDMNAGGAGTSEFADAVSAGAVRNPIVVTAKTPFTFTDENGDTVRVKLTGAGSVNVALQGGLTDDADIDSLTLVGTNLTSKLEVSIVTKDGTTTVNRVVTSATNQHMGSIKLGKNVTLGDGNADTTPDLQVTGKMLSLDLAQIAPNAYLKLGQDLPYNIPNDTKTPDTYNNRPTLTVGRVLGAGMLIEVTGDGTDGGVGGGGFGNITFGFWQDPGTLRTTQSIGNFLVKTGNFNGVLEIDKFHVGNATTANAGSMTIAQGSWGSSGTEVEGNIASFSATEFLAGASITAGSIGSATVTQGDLAGTLILTDPDAASVPTYTVNSDFVGSIVSAQSIKKLNVKGDFTGSLEAPSIGSITAFSFAGVAGMTHIKATAGPLGLLTTKFGGIHDYDIDVAGAFSGIKMTLAKLGADLAGIDNVHVKALSIGNVNVSLTADAKSTGVDLIGVRGSTFTTTGTGTTKTTLGKMGTTTVKLKGAAGGNAIGIDNSTFDARVLAGEFTGNPASTINTLGNVSVTVGGFGGNSVGLNDGTFEGDVLGFTKVSVTRGKDLAATAADVDGSSFTATGNAGYFRFDGDSTASQVTDLEVWAGGKVGAVTVKAKTTTFGNLVGSSILAGQSLQLTAPLDKDLKTALAGAALGAITLSGNLTNTMLVAGASIGAVSVGGDAAGSLILAGARLGGDAIVGNGNDSFQRVAAIASITVKGSFATTSAVAGIASTNGTFGDADDTVAAAVGGITTPGSIGAVTLGAGSGASGPALLTDHNYAIQAQALKSLKLGTADIVKDFAAALFFDPAATEDIADPVVRVLT